jgi:8-oxo-dGTP pyrophosphatase MutT (NUDIX family)
VTEEPDVPELPSAPNPYTTRASRVVYENPWMRVREDDVVRPDGHDGIYGVVTTRVATGVVALTDDDHVVLVGQWRYPLERYSWEIVEGGTDDGEQPREAAARELREEAGLDAAEWEELGGPVHLSNCISAEEGRLFVARGLTEVGADPDGTEQLQRRVVPVTEALARVDDGTITDAMTVVALLRLARARTGGP